MKKLLALSLITSSLMAAESFLTLGVSQSDFKYVGERVSENTYQVGYGVEKTWRNNVYSSISFNFDYADFDSEYMLSYGGDLRLGAQLGAKYKIYAIGSAMQQAFSKSTSGYGFGYGGGMQYDFTKNFAGYTDFKTYDMVEEKGNDYTFDTLLVGMKIKF